MVKLTDYSEQDKKLDDIIDKLESDHLRALRDLEQCQTDLKKAKLMNLSLTGSIAFAVGMFVALRLF